MNSNDFLRSWTKKLVYEIAITIHSSINKLKNMIDLDSDIEKKIHAILFEATDHFNAGETQKSIDTLKDGFDLLPSDAADWDLGYTLVNEICEKAYDRGMVDVVDGWIELYVKCDNAQRGYGNSQFLIGKMAFDRGDTQIAKRAFEIADQRSAGRIWRGEKEMKYFQFFKEK